MAGAVIRDPPATGFTQLVHDEDDLVGLVAHGLVKQTETDWLAAFRETHGRAPDELERGAFILGESLPRRVAVYRHLARETLAGSGLAGDALPDARTHFLARAARVVAAAKAAEARRRQMAPIRAFLSMGAATTLMAATAWAILRFGAGSL